MKNVLYRHENIFITWISRALLYSALSDISQWYYGHVLRDTVGTIYFIWPDSIQYGQSKIEPHRQINSIISCPSYQFRVNHVRSIYNSLVYKLTHKSKKLAGDHYEYRFSASRNTVSDISPQNHLWDWAVMITWMIMELLLALIWNYTSISISIH